MIRLDYNCHYFLHEMIFEAAALITSTAFWSSSSDNSRHTVTRILWRGRGRGREGEGGGGRGGGEGGGEGEGGGGGE